MKQTVTLFILTLLFQLSYTCQTEHQPLSLLQLAYLAANQSIKHELPSLYSDTADKRALVEPIKAALKNISTRLNPNAGIDFYNNPLKTIMRHPVYQGVIQTKLRAAINAHPELYERELLHAVRVQNFSLAKLLIRAGTNSNLTSAGGNTLLHMTTKFDSMEAVSFIEFLLQQKKIDVQRRNQAGLTPLDCAKGYLKKYPTN